MSKTGRYKYDPVTKQMVRISDSTPSLPNGVFWKDTWDHSGYYSEGCGVRFKSKQHKRNYLKEKGIAEAG